MYKTIASLIISLTFLLQVNAQDSTAAKAHAKYWCECLSEVDPQLPEDSILQMVETCQSLSITNLLNKKIIELGHLLDSAVHAHFNQMAIALMLKDCSLLSTLLAPKKETEPVFRKENPQNIFIPDSFYKPFGLIPGEKNNMLHVCNMENKDNKFQRSVDIRWVFNSREDALKWHRLKLEENAEGGEPVKGTFRVDNAEEIKVFRESAKAADMLKAFGLVQRHHYFIFVVENVVCKVFVATDGTVESDGALPFAIAAARQVKENLPE